MFKKQDNPKLFEEIFKAYRTTCPNDYTVNRHTTDRLSAEQLSKITRLKITPTSSKNITRLDGIEQLTNLEDFVFHGQHARTHSSTFEECLQRASLYESFNLDENLEFYEQEYNCCQIEDISPLYACTNLKKLDISNQRKISDIDLSFAPNLTQINMQSCKSLRKIYGLDSLQVLTDPTKLKDGDGYKNSHIDFSGCGILVDVDNFSKIIQTIKNNPHDGQKTNLFLPTTTYAHLCRRYPDMQNFLDSHLKATKNDIVKWTEIGAANLRIETNSSQMSMIRDRVDQILRTLFQYDDGSNITRIAQVFRWICDNTTYDRRLLNLTKNEMYSEKFRDDIRKAIRSTYVTLFDNKAVCVGVSNLFNFFMAELGLLSEPVSCRAEQFLDPRITESNHQISKVHTKAGVYYCDPTADLSYNESQYFLLNKDEISQVHSLTVADYQENSAPSIQKLLNKRGLLTSKCNSNIVHSI